MSDAMAVTEPETLEAADESAPGDAGADRDPTMVITAAVAGVLFLLATLLAVGVWAYAFGAFGSRPGLSTSEGAGARPWHFWIGVAMTSGLPYVVAAVGFGYYWKLLRPRYLDRR